MELSALKLKLEASSQAKNKILEQLMTYKEKYELMVSQIGDKRANREKIVNQRSDVSSFIINRFPSYFHIVLYLYFSIFFSAHRNA